MVPESKHGSDNTPGTKTKIRIKKKRSAYVDEEVSDNPYYLTISHRYKYAKLIVIAMFVLYLLLMISLRRDDITIENLKYMFKYIDLTPDGESEQFGNIVYDADSKLTFSLYRGDIATASSKGVTIYDSAGNSVMTADESFTDPVIRTSSKYMMAYDFGGSHFSIYNSFTQLYTESFDYPVSGGAISDSAVFAIVTRTLEYKSAVQIYDKNFKVINRVLKDKYVADIDLSTDGKEILIASYNVVDGEFYTELMALPTDSDTPRLLFNLADTLPLKIKYSSDGGFMLLSDRSVMYYNESGIKRGEYAFSGLPTDVKLCGDYAVAAFNRNLVGYNNAITVTDVAGNIIYTTSLSGQIVDIDVNGSETFVLLDGTLTYIDLSMAVEKTIATDKNSLGVLSMGDGGALVCYSNYAKAYFFGNNADNTDNIVSSEAETLIDEKNEVN